MRNALIVVGIGAIILAAGWWFLAHQNTPVVENEMPQQTATRLQTPEEAPSLETQGAAIGDENLAEFYCDDGKTITAVFERDIVGLTLSDGRQILLREAVSGVGNRYLSNDETIEFRGEGNEGTLIEKGVTTYSACETG
jgi:membrane-bound inhibitor of C-type lysozyme